MNATRTIEDAEKLFNIAHEESAWGKEAILDDLRGELNRMVTSDPRVVALVEAARKAQDYIRLTLPRWSKAEDLPPIMHELFSALKPFGK